MFSILLKCNDLLKYKFTAVLLFASILFISCDEAETPVNSETNEVPKIDNLTTDKSKIVIGGDDPATITCEASGGNLEYLWEVDLGDIFPMNENSSKVRFTGSSCCIGEKTIKCTVRNNKGSDSKEIKINVLAPPSKPRIFNISAEKLDVKIGESISIKCFAAGGFLKSEWTTDCGKFSEFTEDSLQVTYTPSQECLGKQTIKCNVSNMLGFAERTIDINVIE